MSRELVIGNLVAKIPVVQGGMGVGISLSKLAGAVAKAGGIGTISTAQIGFNKEGYEADAHRSNIEAIGEYIAQARKIAQGGILAVNIMVATTGYEDYVKAAVQAGIDIVVSGAGLPMNLPELVAGSETKIAPIVSSRKAAMVIIRQWMKKYNRFPDLVVVEGPLAGGHLGFSRDEIDGYVNKTNSYDDEVKLILDYINEVSEQNGVHIPVVVGGGVFDRTDADHFMAMGAEGVQIGTRFVATKECDAAQAYKLAYVNAKDEDVVIVKSPVGMPGRAIKNAFLERVAAGERIMGKCRKCVKSCDPSTTPYCISRALTNAAIGNIDEGLIFCGGNVGRVDKIVTVAEIMAEFA